MPRITIENDRVFKTVFGLPIFEGNLDPKLHDFKEYFMMS
jgi:hypothetical protein